MNAIALLWLAVAAAGVAMGTAGAIIMVRSRSVPRVAVAAQLLGSRSVFTWTEYDIVYPDPWGRPLTATVTTYNFTLRSAFTTPYTPFSGWVWVNPQKPWDVCTRRWGRYGELAMSLLLLGALMTALGLALGLAFGLPGGAR